MTTRRQDGFSMIEVMIVLGIGMILIAMAAPLVSTTINMSRLRGAAGDYANLLQTARMRAVSDDKYYNVVSNPPLPALPPNTTLNAYVNTGAKNGGGPDPGNTYIIGDPVVAFNPAIVIRDPTTAPGIANLRAQYLPAGAIGNVSINPVTNPWGPSFGPRGLPCAPTALAGGQCLYTFASFPIAFEVFLQNLRTGIWEAVTVNPSGRLRQWHYNITTATWQPLN
jgi:prepilin-type N-terminal cleavage/methylation domain-containing protein